MGQASRLDLEVSQQLKYGEKRWQVKLPLSFYTTIGGTEFEMANMLRLTISVDGKLHSLSLLSDCLVR